MPLFEVDILSFSHTSEGFDTLQDSRVWTRGIGYYLRKNFNKAMGKDFLTAAFDAILMFVDFLITLEEKLVIASMYRLN